METFRKRQKEMKRLEKQRDKAAKRKEIKARKAAGLVEPEDGAEISGDASMPEEAPETPAEANEPLTN